MTGNFCRFLNFFYHFVFPFSPYVKKRYLKVFDIINTIINKTFSYTQNYEQLANWS